METKDVILELRNKAGLSQDELAEKVYVTRQAVSRWEKGETTPNTETLKLLSKLFDVSINTLLATPREMICHCCGMSLDDTTTSKEIDGIFNEEYCKWCYNEGEFTLNVEGLPFIVTKNSKEALREQAVAMLMLDLKRTEERAEMEGWIDADDLKRELGIID